MQKKTLRKEIRMSKKLTGILSCVVAFGVALSVALTSGCGLFKTDDGLVDPENQEIVSTPENNTPENTEPEKEEGNNNAQKEETPVVTPVVTPSQNENGSEITETLPEGEDGETSEELLPGQIPYKDYPFNSTSDAVKMVISLSSSLAFKKSLLTCDGSSLSVKQGHTTSSATIALDFEEITFGGSNAVHIKVDATEQTETSLIKFMLKAGKAAEMKLGGEYYLIDNNGRVFKYNHSSNRSVSIPAGFNGYVVLGFDQFVMMNNQSIKLNEAEISGIQIQFQSVEKDQTKTIRFSDFGMYYNFDSTDEVYNASYVSLSAIDSENYPYKGLTVDNINKFDTNKYVNVIGGYTTSLGKAAEGRIRITQQFTGSSNGMKISVPYKTNGYSAVSIQVDNTENTTYSWLKFGIETPSGTFCQKSGATSYLISREGVYYSYKNTNSTVSIAIPAGFKGNLVLPLNTFVSDNGGAVNTDNITALTVIIKNAESNNKKHIYLDEFSFIIGSLEVNQIVESDFEFAGLETVVFNDFSKKTEVGAYNGGLDVSALTIADGRLKINLSHTSSSAVVTFQYGGDSTDKVALSFDIDCSELEGASYIKILPLTTEYPDYAEALVGGSYYLYSNGKYYKNTIGNDKSCYIPKGFKGTLILSFKQITLPGKNNLLDPRNLSGGLRLQLHNVTMDPTKNIYIDNVGYISTETALSGTMQQVPMGGGGYVTGFVIHPLDSSIKYMRTDVGGAYRWDEDNNKWVQMCYYFGTKSALYGVDGLAIDPNNKDIVYIAVGNGEGGGKSECGVYKSTDRGETWTRILYENFYGNSGGRQYGECIMVDPNNSNVIYVATRMHGLYYTRDGGKNWTNVDRSVVPVNYVDYKTNPYGLRSIVVDTRTVVDGRSKVIYVAGRGVGVYYSTDGGNNWQHLDGSPDNVKQLRIASDGTVYMTAQTGVFMFYNGVVTELITPDDKKMFNAIAVDPTDPETLIVCRDTDGTNDCMGLEIYYSQDRGQNWIHKNSSINKIDKLAWWPKYYFSSATATLTFDPNDTKQVWFTDWYGVWMTYDIHDTTVDWYSKVRGHEECVTMDKLTFPEGPAEVLIGTVDNGRLYYEDITEYPRSPANNDARDLAYCYSQPNFVIQATSGGNLMISYDYGETFNTSVTSGAANTNKVAISATNPDNIVVLGWGDGPYYTKDGGATWQTSTGVSAGNYMKDKWARQDILEPDGVNGNIFYYVGLDGLYKSVDGGATFTLVNANFTNNKLDDYSVIYSVYGKEGMLYAIKSSKLYVSTDYGSTFAEITTIESVSSFSYGAGISKSDVALYFIGTHNGVSGLFISDDYGATWQLMKDSYSLSLFGSVTGDMQIYGRCFLQSGGLGVVVVYK